MDLLSDVINIFNEPSFFFNLYVSMRRVNLCGHKEKSYINGAQWLKSQAYLKWVVASRVVNRFVVAMLHIRKVVIPCAWMFGVVHPQDVHDHHIDHLCLPIRLGMEGSGFSRLVTHVKGVLTPNIQCGSPSTIFSTIVGHIKGGREVDTYRAQP